MYKLHKNLIQEIDAVIRLSDNVLIPFDPDNADYQEYLKWLSEGNEPQLADKGTA